MVIKERTLWACAYLLMTLFWLGYASHATANIVDITDDQLAGSVTAGGAVVTFDPSPADLILYGTNADLTNQSPGGIQSDLENVIGQSLLLTGAVDGLAGSAITLPFAANLYYLHYGDNGIAFGYDSPVPQTFSVAGLPNDLSNYRLYALDIVGEVNPTAATAPGTIALLSLGLVGLIVARSRK